MDTLTIDKSDIKFVLILATLAPIFSFIAGALSVHISSSSESAITTPVSLAKVEHFRQEPAQATVADARAVAPALERSKKVNRVSVPQSKYSKQYVVQAGVFSQRKNARAFAQSLKQAALSARVVRDFADGSIVYRVNVASFDTELKAKEFTQMLLKSHELDLYITYSNASRTAHAIAAL